MSKIGKQPIKIPEGITVELKDGALVIKGVKGKAEVKILPLVNSEIKNGEIIFTAKESSKAGMANWGTMRALTKNAVDGLTSGFEKILEIEGVGFRASLLGKDLALNIGYSHPVKITPPDGINISVEKNAIKVSGIDKYLVGQVAADIRALKKPEPYKGKGIRYRGEVIMRKAGKKVAGTTT
ncbi:MAG: 50S ribosomal protein L6 [Candidatus Liptonbacteria bacterium]|nr:50S ribosomal protein L6 [Candidatus Liptonbacteria bacterium]